MATVTGIVESPRKDGRYVVEVDGRAGPTVSLEIIERLSIRVGAELDEARQLRLDEAAAALRTYDRPLNMPAFQARSARDLRRKRVQTG